jgi:hypothetical protein
VLGGGPASDCTVSEVSVSLDGGAWLVSEVSVLLDDDDDSLVSDDSVLLDDDSYSSSPQSGRIERIVRTEPRASRTCTSPFASGGTP